MKKLITLFLWLLVASCDAREPVHQAAPLNSSHRFVFNWCDFSYNEKSFLMGKSIDSVIPILGNYDRKIDFYNTMTTYVWDSLGTRIETNQLQEIEKIEIFFNLDTSPNLMRYDDFSPEQAKLFKELDTQKELSNVRTYLQDSIMIDGVLLDQNINNIEPINHARFEWARKHNKIPSSESYDRVMGKGKGTRSRFDKNMQPIKPEGMDYYLKTHLPEYVTVRECADSRLLFTIFLQTKTPSKVHTFSISRMN